MKRILVLILLLASSRLTMGQTPSGQIVFNQGEKGVHTYRIPAIVRTQSGVLLAFAEARHGGSSDTGDIDLVVKRSLDGGKTWGEMITIWDDGANVCGNPAPVVDRRTGRVVLLATWNDGRDHEPAIHHRTSFNTRRVFCLYSDDEGLTWSEPKDITAQAKVPEWTWYATGPGHALQLRDGRLVVGCDHGNFGGRSTSHVIYSDDGGDTWQIGGGAGVGNESTVVELPGGDLMLNMRNNLMKGRGADDIWRQVAISKDRGISFEPPYSDKALVEPVCQASLINRSVRRRPSKVLYFSNPEHASKRRNMTLRMSKDAGKTWKRVATITEGPASYSDLVILKGGDVGVLYEGGEKTAIDAIYFTRIPRKNLK